MLWLPVTYFAVILMQTKYNLIRSQIYVVITKQRTGKHVVYLNIINGRNRIQPKWPSTVITTMTVFRQRLWFLFAEKKGKNYIISDMFWKPFNLNPSNYNDDNIRTRLASPQLVYSHYIVSRSLICVKSKTLHKIIKLN